MSVQEQEHVPGTRTRGTTIPRFWPQSLEEDGRVPAAESMAWVADRSARLDALMAAGRRQLWHHAPEGMWPEEQEQEEQEPPARVPRSYADCEAWFLEEMTLEEALAYDATPDAQAKDEERKWPKPGVWMYVPDEVLDELDAVIEEE